MYLLVMKERDKNTTVEKRKGERGKSRKEVNVGRIKVKEWEKDVD